jgi:hypothetical protein
MIFCPTVTAPPEKDISNVAPIKPKATTPVVRARMKRSRTPQQHWRVAPSGVYGVGPKLPPGPMLHEMMGAFRRASCAAVQPATEARRGRLQQLKLKTVTVMTGYQRSGLLKRIGAITLILIALTFAAKAAPITGDIDFGGVVTFDIMSLATATRVTQWSSSFVLKDSGDFATFVNPGTNATMAAPWIFNPSTPTPSLWAVGGFNFDLANSVIVSQSSTFLDITGTGTITGHGFDPTPGTWSFTASRSDAGTSATFGFQAEATAVPESGSVILFILGGVCLVGTKSLRKRTALR